MNKNTIISGVAALLAVVALVVGLAFHGSTPTPVSTTQVGGSLDGSTINSPWNFTNGLSEGGNEVKFTQAGNIGATQNVALWKNTSNRVVYIDYAEQDLVPTTSSIAYSSYAIASSSYLFSIGTTTAATTTAGFSNSFSYVKPFATLVDNVKVATSTSQVATTSINSDVVTGNGEGTVPVLPGQAVYFLVRQADTCLQGPCEGATSTLRGFNIHYFLDGHYQP